ncbi:MAG: group II intron reverse transcriptase domain-containing protein [Nitrospirae bacterium]|nr:group II intron reverse transcriptase domain-containing protein [Nitrospirota bacterium]
MFGACAAESDRLYSFRTLHKAYVSCRRRKRNTINALRFEASLLDNLMDLSGKLQNGSYRPSRSVCFVAKQPKLREIFAADFRDRVVHHLLVPEIEKIFEPKFIHDSYACRVGKGTHAAVKRLRHFMNCVTRGGRVASWFMQLDIRSFFMSIDREILLGMLERQFLRDSSAGRHSRESGNPEKTELDSGLQTAGMTEREALLQLAEIIVNQDCTKDFVYKGDPRLLQGIPPHKSLFHIPQGKGLPIGNLTSQFFGNVYLNELDQFVKHTLKARHYLRYVDDFILLDTSRERLLEMKDKIETFLNERLALELKPELTLKRVTEGADFLGYIVRPDYVLVRNRVVGNLRARLRRFEEEMVISSVRHISCRHSRESGNPEAFKNTGFPIKTSGMTNKDFCTSLLYKRYSVTIPKQFNIIHLREENVCQLRQTLASYLGHFKHANAYKLTRSLFEKYEYLENIFTVNNGGCLIPLHEPSFKPVTFRGQYKWATKQNGRRNSIRIPASSFRLGNSVSFTGSRLNGMASFLV